MREEKSIEAKPQKRAVLRLTMWIVSIVVVLIVLALLLLPAFVSSKKGQQIISAKINRYINGRANFINLSMGWFKGIKITGFSFKDNAGLTSVQVKQIATKPHYSSLLMGDLSFGQTVIDQPKVSVNLKNRPETKLERVGQPVPVKTRNIDLVMDVVVNDGDLKITDSKAKTVELSQINSTLSLRPLGQQSNFKVDMAVTSDETASASKISAAGQVTPSVKNGWSLQGTTGGLTIEVNDLNLASIEPILELANVGLQTKGVLTANVTGEVKDGRIENLAARIKVKNLDITGPQLKGDRLQSSILDVDVKLSQKEQVFNIERFHVQSDWAQADAGGTVPVTLKSLAEILQGGTNLSLKGNFSCDVAAVLSQLPKTTGLKEGMKVTSGRLSGSVSTLAQAGKTSITGQAGLTELSGAVDGKKLAISEPVTVAVEITGEKNRISFDKLNVSAAFAKINAKGNLEQINYDAQLDLNKLQSELGQFVDIGPYKLAGQLLNKGQVSVKGDKITAAGTSTVKELVLSSKGGVTATEPSAEVAFAVDYDKKGGVLAIGSVTINASLGQVSIKDAVLPLGKEASKPIKLLASAQKIDLAKLQPFMVLFAAFPQDMQLSGIAESQVSVTSQKDVYQVFTDSTKIHSFKLIAPKKEPFQQEEVSLILDAEINPAQKAINVKKLELESPQIKIKKGQFNKADKEGNTTLQGSAELEYDWSAVSGAISAFLPQGLEMAGQRKDTLNFFCRYPVGQTDKLMAGLDSKAKIGFQNAQYMGLHFGPTDVDIQIRNGLLEIAPFTTAVNNGQLKFAALADFKQKPVVFKTPGPIDIAKDIQINKETTEKLLMYVNPLFANAAGVSGVANFKCDKLAIPLEANAVNDIEVVGAISVSNLRLQTSDLLGQILAIAGTDIQGQYITIHPTNFTLRKGFLRYNDMQVDIGDRPINFKGVIGLNKSLDMTVTLPYTSAGKTARVGGKTVGERITLPLKGTITKPELDTAKLLQDQVKQQLEEQLRRGLEGILR